MLKIMVDQPAFTKLRVADCHGAPGEWPVVDRDEHRQWHGAGRSAHRRTRRWGQHRYGPDLCRFWRMARSRWSTRRRRQVRDRTDGKDGGRVMTQPRLA